MKIIKNDRLIKRNARIGQWTSLAALGVLAAGMYISFKRPELFVYSLGALVLGFAMTQIGMFFSNRWARSPRPDEQLDSALKGLPGDTTLYHFVTPASHLLVGPAGLWILQPYHQRGQLTYTKNRWRLSRGGFMQFYMTIFGQEGLGRPDIDAAYQIESLRKYLEKQLDGTNPPAIQAALIFTNDQLQIDAADAPLPALKIKQLKDFMRQKAKERPIGALALEQVKSALPQE
jgi:hypothetical protein